MELDLLSSRINLNHTCIKLEISLYEIKTNHPKRTDLITSMQSSLKDIRRAMLVYDTLEKEFRAARQNNFDFQRLNLKQAQEIKDLKKQLEFKDLEL
jgi:vacuolar-type H+-ATPase subunit I/STV1